MPHFGSRASQKTRRHDKLEKHKISLRSTAYTHKRIFEKQRNGHKDVNIWWAWYNITYVTYNIEHVIDTITNRKY